MLVVMLATFSFLAASFDSSDSSPVGEVSRGQSPSSERLSHDPNLSNVGICYWNSLGTNDQQVIRQFIDKGAIENALKYGVTFGNIYGCDHNVHRHQFETLWVVRGRMMRETALQALREKGVTQQQLDDTLENNPTFRESVRRGASNFIAVGDGHISVQDFGFKGTGAINSEDLKYLENYGMYYYIGSAIERAIVEKMN